MEGREQGCEGLWRGIDKGGGEGGSRFYFLRGRRLEEDLHF